MESLMTNDLEHCAACGKYGTEIHHCLHGNANRKLADKYHLVVGLCHDCHMRLHDSDTKMDRHFQMEAQRCFEEHYSHEEFMKIFGRNYL